ncbi:hypothetical protein [Streptomyces sp. NPDC055400]
MSRQLARKPDRRPRRPVPRSLGPSGPHISDDELRTAIETNRLRLMDELGIDLTVFSPRASFMSHHKRPDKPTVA